MSAPAHAGDAVATQVARLYFDRQLSKVEIGQRLGISRFRVARLLREAREAGLVRVEYRDVPRRDAELSRDLELRFEVDLCAVAAGSRDPDAAAVLGAEVVADLVTSEETLGVAWGSTLAATIGYLPRRAFGRLRVVPLAGGWPGLAHDRAPGELARRCAERLGGTHLELYAPAFVATPQLRNALAEEAGVSAVFAAYDRLTTAVVGIGSWPAAAGRGRAAGSSLLASGAVSRGELDELRAAGAVGELVVHPFDAAGRFLPTALTDRAVAIPLDRLRRVRRVVAIAAGREKAGAIRAALASGVVDVLVTDASTAVSVLAQDAA
jgi:DNA-binding transcriptional regulator LsrR (DeoR family)